MSVLTPLTEHGSYLLLLFTFSEDLPVDRTHCRVREQYLHLVTEHLPLKWGQVAW